MEPTRRDIFRYAGAVTAVTSSALVARRALGAAAEANEPTGHGPALPPNTHGVLVDLTECIGCRLCEYACKKANGLPAGELASYDDTSVFAEKRRPSPAALTVVNAWQPLTEAGNDDPVYAKVNCVHCNHAACVSACIVGALEKKPSGAVVYDAWKCIGCRYCMVACPFQIPAYEYQNVLTPQVRKCQLCEHRTSKGELPACVQECPRQVMTYGPRDALLALAHEKIKAHPGRYVDHVYGEHEVGGTSWLYLSPVPHEAAGFLAVGTAAPPVLTEEIQHGVFKYWIAPLGWYAFLAGAFWVTGRRAKLQHEAHHPPALLQAPAAECGPIVTLHHTRHRDAEGGDGVATALLDPPEETTRATARLASAAATGGPAEGPRQAHSRHVDAPPARHGHEHPVLAQPAGGKLLTPGVWVLIALVAIGAIAAAYRFAFGLAASTNLDQQHPWGLWIAMDVGSGIALAGGGFVTAALVHIFHREHYHSIARSALLTALLGYTFYVPGLLADLGRWYNLWHPTIPTMWQGNSVLFEVGLCVMIYLNVQYAELMPIICERFMGPGGKRPWVAKWAKFTHDNLERIMPALLILGVALSTFHQSSLGNLMVIAPYKLHALWWTPVSPILFLLSAMMVGFPMVIFTLLFGAWSLKRKPDMKVLAPLARYVPVFLVPYLGLKIGDMVVRGTYSYLAHPSVQSVAWVIEVVGGVVVPTVMLLMPRVRQSPRGLATACLLVIMGVVLNRLNVFIIGYHPPYATQTYFPSLVEMALSLGLVAALMLVYRVAVMYLPILDPAPAAEGQSQ